MAEYHKWDEGVISLKIYEVLLQGLSNRFAVNWQHSAAQQPWPRITSRTLKQLHWFQATKAQAYVAQLQQHLALRAYSTRNKCIASSNKCLTSCNKKLLVASLVLLVSAVFVTWTSSAIAWQWRVSADLLSRSQTPEMPTQNGPLDVFEFQWCPID